MTRFALTLIVLVLASTSGAQAPELSAEVLEEQIWELQLQGSYVEAAEVARELVALRKGDPEARPFEVADAERLAETLQYIAGLPDEEQRELAVADSLTAVDGTCREESRYDDAATAVRRQLEIRRRLLGNEHPDVSASLNSLAHLHDIQGDFVVAESLFRETLEIDRRLLGDEHPYVATDLNNLSSILRAQGDYAGAEPLLREALAVWRASLGDEHMLVANGLGNLAHLLHAKGDHEGAESPCREALAIRSALFGDEHPHVAMSLGDLAVILNAQGDYAGAEPLFRKALAMQRELLGNEHRHVATSLHNLAQLLRAKGDHAGAELLFRESLTMRQALFGDEHPQIATSLNYLAVILEAQGDYAGAEPLFSRALTMRRSLLGDEHPHVATTLGGFAHLLEAQGDYADAEPLYREALAMRKTLLGDLHPDVAVSMNNLAINLKAQGDYAGAEPLLRDALAMQRDLLGNEHPFVATGCSNLAALLYVQGDPVGAELLLAEAARVYDFARLRVGEGIERAAFQKSPYPRLASVRLALGRTDEAWPAVEKARARSLADLMMAAAERELSPSESVQEDSLKRVLGSLEQGLTAYREAALGDTTGDVPGQIEAARDALLAAESEWSAFRREMSAKYPVTEGTTFPLARVQSAMSDETAMVGWLDASFGDDVEESWCYAIRSSGPVIWTRARSTSTEGDRRSSHDRVRSFRDRLASVESPYAAVKRESRELWRDRIEPLAGALMGVEELIVVPSGAMLGVPIEVLVDNDGKSMGEMYAVSYVPSATLHTWLAEHSDRETGGGTLLIGDPPYNPAHLDAMERDDQVLLASAEPLPEAATLRSALAGNDDALSALPRLIGTRAEVAAVAAVSEPHTLLLGPDASEQELAQLAGSEELAEFQTIHIATHALVDDERPRRSALVLSQVDLPDALGAATAGTRIYDGLVTATEIVRDWDLDADLVTLSACETGLGKEVAGEGYVGFAHAFFQAGARSLLVSLWKVEDTATSLLMQRFYENWSGEYENDRNGRAGERMSKTDALQEAKHWLRTYTDESGDHPYEHPYFWSAFVLIGDRT